MKEFYANFSSLVLDPNSPWFHKIYVRDHTVQLSPKAICSLFELSKNNVTTSLANLLKMRPSKVAMCISTDKASIFYRSEVSPAQLTLKFLCLFRVCSKNILPTINSSCLSSYMGHLIFFIDQNLEFIDVGSVVITKMLEYAIGVVAKNKVLPYQTLTTKLLEVNKITPREDEVVVPLKSTPLARAYRICLMILCDLNFLMAKS